MAPTKPDAGTRIQALSLLQTKTQINEIVRRTGTERSIYRFQKKAKERGYDHSKDIKLFSSHVEDAPRSGRPKKITPALVEEVIKTISKNSTARELSTQQIANTLSSFVKGGISAQTIYRILRRRGYKPLKQS